MVFLPASQRPASYSQSVTKCLQTSSSERGSRKKPEKKPVICPRPSFTCVSVTFAYYLPLQSLALEGRNHTDTGIHIVPHKPLMHNSKAEFFFFFPLSHALVIWLNNLGLHCLNGTSGGDQRSAHEMPSVVRHKGHLSRPGVCSLDYLPSTFGPNAGLFSYRGFVSSS